MLPVGGCESEIMQPSELVTELGFLLFKLILILIPLDECIPIG